VEIDSKVIDGRIDSGVVASLRDRLFYMRRAITFGGPGVHELGLLYGTSNDDTSARLVALVDHIDGRVVTRNAAERTTEESLQFFSLIRDVMDQEWIVLDYRYRNVMATEESGKLALRPVDVVLLRESELDETRDSNPGLYRLRMGQLALSMRSVRMGHSFANGVGDSCWQSMQGLADKYPQAWELSKRD